MKKRLSAMMFCLVALILVSGCSVNIHTNNTGEENGNPDAGILEEIRDANETDALISRNERIRFEGRWIEKSGTEIEFEIYEDKDRYAKNYYDEDLIIEDGKAYGYIHNENLPFEFLMVDDFDDFVERYKIDSLYSYSDKEEIVSEEEKDGLIYLETKALKDDVIDIMETYGYLPDDFDYALSEYTIDGSTKEIVNLKMYVVKDDEKNLCEDWTLERACDEYEIPPEVAEGVFGEDTRTLTVIADPGTDEEEEFSLTVAKGCQIYVFTGDRYEAVAYWDPDLTEKATNRDLTKDLTIYIGHGSADTKQDELSLWNDGARAKEELVSYINAITDEGNPDYIPPERRIAVFDMDGTLCCETDPIYFDHMLYLHRVLNDPDFTADEEELKIADKIFDFIETGTYPEDLFIEHGQGIASSFKGMTLKDFDRYVKEYRDTPMAGYDGMTKGEAFYKPMIQVVDYLNDNDFTVYIVSGTDELVSRGLVEGVLNIPMNQIIGSDERVAATGQGDENGLDYTYQADDELVMAGEFIIKTIKMNKVSAIHREIGIQPVLSFGNTSGDFAMDMYTISNNPYKSLAFQLCCDDLERENGNLDKAEKMAQSCEEYGFIPISMKNDWKTIYGDGVTKKSVPDVEFVRKEQ